MFKVGDKLTLIKKGRLSTCESKKHIKKAVYGEVYTASKVGKMDDVWRISFSVLGIDNAYLMSLFRKIEPHKFTNELTGELANKPLIKERVEKIKEKQAA